MLRQCDYGALRLRSGKVTESEIEDHEQRRGILGEKGQEDIGAAPVHHVGGQRCGLFPSCDSSRSGPRFPYRRCSHHNASWSSV